MTAATQVTDHQDRQSEVVDIAGRTECMGHTRRTLLAGLGLAGLQTMFPSLVKNAEASSVGSLWRSTRDAAPCAFSLAVLNDEITQDFEKACQIVAGDFGLQWIELRSMWNKNVTELNT